jgi:hypothetical protein
MGMKPAVILLLPSLGLSLFENGLSDKMLQRDDFQIFDHGHPVSIKTFNSRPLALGSVVQCYMRGLKSNSGENHRGRL